MLTLDLLATFAFALVGARVAADKGLDYGGVAFIAAVASLSGGTLRNVFLGIRPVWIIDPWIVLSVIAAVLLTLVFRRVTHIGKTLLIMDTFGLAVAAMSGKEILIREPLLQPLLIHIPLQSQVLFMMIGTCHHRMSSIRCVNGNEEMHGHQMQQFAQVERSTLEQVQQQQGSWRASTGPLLRTPRSAPGTSASAVATRPPQMASRTTPIRTTPSTFGQFGLFSPSSIFWICTESSKWDCNSPVLPSKVQIRAPSHHNALLYEGRFALMGYMRFICESTLGDWVNTLPQYSFRPNLKELTCKNVLELSLQR